MGCPSGECQPAPPVGPPGWGTPIGAVSTRSGLLGPESPTDRARLRARGGRREAGTRPWCRTFLGAGPSTAGPAVRDNGRGDRLLRTLPVRPADDVLVAAVEPARAAAVETAGDPDLVGEHLAATPEPIAPVTDEVPAEALGAVLTHTFASKLPGYVGWHWAVTVTRAADSDQVTVDEVVLLPGDVGAAGPGLGAVARAAAAG